MLSTRLEESIYTAEIAGNSTLSSSLGLEFGVLKGDLGVIEQTQDTVASMPLATDRLTITIAPEIKITEEGIESQEDDFETHSPLSKQKLTQALRYALSIIASYELEVKQNIAYLPPEFGQGHVLKSARSDILHMAGIKADHDLYEIDDISI